MSTDESSSGTTFISCSSGDSTFSSCKSDLDSPRSSMNSSQDLDKTLEDQDPEEEVELEGEDEIETEEEGSSFDMQLNGEALDALEENLKQQLEQIMTQEKQFDAMFDSVTGKIELCNNDVMERTEEIKRQTAVVENQTKELILERDQALGDLRNVESAFSDVHRKYERAKVVLENLKTNEDHLIQRDEELQLLISARDEKLGAFQQEMHQRMEQMYNDFQGKLSVLDAENSKVAAQYRRSEMRIETLESELAHKQKENAQLNSLADDLIGKNAK